MSHFILPIIPWGLLAITVFYVASGYYKYSEIRKPGIYIPFIIALSVAAMYLWGKPIGDMTNPIHILMNFVGLVLICIFCLIFTLRILENPETDYAVNYAKDRNVFLSGVCTLGFALEICLSANFQ